MDKDDIKSMIQRELSLRPNQNISQIVFALKGHNVHTSNQTVSGILKSDPIFTTGSGAKSLLWRLVDLDADGNKREVEELDPSIDIGSIRAQVYPPRQWQEEALQEWVNHKHRGVIEAVTGSGKSILGVYAAEEALRQGGRVLVLTPTTDLVSQWVRLFQGAFPELPVGKQGDGSHDTLFSHPIVVSTIQSAHKKTNLCPPALKDNPNLLIADECHTYGAEKYRKGLDSAFTRRLGLTATYGRDDMGEQVHLSPYFGGIIYHFGYKEAIEQKAVAEFVVSLVGVDLLPRERDMYNDVMEELTKQRRVLVNDCHVPQSGFLRSVAALCGGYNPNPKAQRAARVYMTKFNERKRILGSSDAKMAVLRRMHPIFVRSNKAIVFCQTVETSQKAEMTLQGEFFDARAYTSGMNKRERKALLESFADPGGVSILCAPKVLDEGIDVPAADVGVILAASSSQRQMIQRMGRVIRPKKDGRRAQFVILYVKGSNEDPSKGAHETFLDEILEAASEINWYDEDNLDDLTGAAAAV